MEVKEGDIYIYFNLGVAMEVVVITDYGDNVVLVENALGQRFITSKKMLN